MPEELSPESKLFIKEEIEKVRKENKEELEKVKSKSTKTFAAIAIVVGLLTGLGVYGLVVNYIGKVMEEQIGKGTRDEITQFRDDSRSLKDEILGIKTQAKEILSQLKRFDQHASQNGYAWVGDIKLVWGTGKSTSNYPEKFTFEEPFDNNCFAVVPGIPGYVNKKDVKGFEFDRLQEFSGTKDFEYLAIGN